MSISPRSRSVCWRLVAYGLLALSMAVLLGATWWLRRPGGVDPAADRAARDWAAEPAVRLLREYVRIDTSAATGDERAGAQWLAARLRAAGVEPQVELLGSRNANLWAVIEGSEPGALVLHHHIDVANVERPELWTNPPFAAVYEPPWLIGRGVLDMKALAVAQLSAFLHLARSGERPRRSLVLLATGDEETGSRLGSEWLLRRHPELVRRFWAVLTEGGVVEAVGAREVKFWGVEVAQKRFADGVFCAASRRRLEELRGDLVEHSLHPVSPLTLTPVVDRVLRAYAPTRGRAELTAILSRPARVLRDLAAYRRLPPYLQSMYRAEAVPMAIEATDGGYRLPFVLHLPLGVDRDAALARLVPDWMTAGVAMHVGPARGADHASPLLDPVPQALRATVRQNHPQAPFGPWLVPWSATDARFFRQAGIPTYGFSPFVVVATDTQRIDGPNERLHVAAFVRGVDLYAQAVRHIVR